jgi:hypothetical protein
MPCAPGWPVWSVARHGGGLRARVSCKVNYAATVKEMMPCGPGTASRYSVVMALLCYVYARSWHTMPAFRVDRKEGYAHNYLYTRTLLCPGNRTPTPRPWPFGNRAA